MLSNSFALHVQAEHKTPYHTMHARVGVSDVSVWAMFGVRLRKSTPKMACLPMLHLNADNMLTMTPHNKML